MTRAYTTSIVLARAYRQYAQEDKPAAAAQVTSFKDAMASLEQVQHFLDFRGMMHEPTILSHTVEDLARVSANSS